MTTVSPKKGHDPSRVNEGEKARQATYADFIHDYNNRRAHTAIGGLTPMQRVHDVTGKYI